MKRPTQEQIERFWEWCGFKFQTLKELKPQYRHEANRRWLYPTGETGGLPPIDLNNLFRWAVPKLGYLELKFAPNKLLPSVKVESIDSQPGADEPFYAQGETPALALFWAISKVINQD